MRYSPGNLVGLISSELGVRATPPGCSERRCSAGLLLGGRKHSVMAAAGWTWLRLQLCLDWLNQKVRIWVERLGGGEGGHHLAMTPKDTRTNKLSQHMQCRMSPNSQSQHTLPQFICKLAPTKAATYTDTDTHLSKCKVPIMTIFWYIYI